MKTTGYLIMLLMAAWAGAVNAAEIRQYAWLTNGVKSGSLVLTIDRDSNTRSAEFEFNDRGRGPKISETVRFGPGGKVQYLGISGHSYMGAPVDESFERSSTATTWKSTLEEGSSQELNAFYLANDGTPEQTAILARALLNGPARGIDLLPSGRASISKLEAFNRTGSSVFTEGPGTVNQSLSLSLYAISGMGVSPEFIWLDQNNELFALAAGGMGLVPEGWTHIMNRLRQQQNAAEKAYFRKRSGRVTHEIPGDYVITRANVVDVESGRLLEDHAVVVRNGIIASVSPGLPDSEELERFDANGAFLAPGLWDMHTHLSLEQGLLHLAAGVTTVRDMGNNPDNYQAIRESFDSGVVAGPRSFAAGIVEGKSPFSAPIREQAESAGDAVDLVRKYAGMDYPQIKVYSSVEPSWLSAIADEAHAQGMRVSGHVPAYMTAEQAVRQGFDEIQHINMLFLNFLAGPDDDTRTPLRFSMVAEQAACLDLDSDEVREFLDLLKSKGVVIDPTIAIFDNMFRHRSGELSPSFAMVADHFPPAMKRSMLAGRMNIDDSNADRYAESARALMNMLLRLYENGIRIVAGTDSLPGFGLHRELEMYQQAGIPAASVLRVATLGAAEVMGVADTRGSVTAGKQADLVLLASNPLEDIGAVRSVQRVFKGNQYFKPAQAYLAMGIRPFNQ